MVLKAHKIEPVCWRIGKRWASLMQLAYMIHANEILNFKKKKKKSKANWRKKDKKYINFCLMLRHKAAEKEIPFKRRESSMSYSTVAPQIWWNVKGNVLVCYCNVTYKSCIIIRRCQDCANSCAVDAPTKPVPSVTCFQRHRTATSTT